MGDYKGLPLDRDGHIDGYHLSRSRHSRDNGRVVDHGAKGKEIAQRIMALDVQRWESIAALARRIGVQYHSVYGVLRRFAPEWLAEHKRRYREWQHLRSKWGAVLDHLEKHDTGSLPIPSDIPPAVFRRRVMSILQFHRLTYRHHWSVRVVGSAVHVKRGKLWNHASPLDDKRQNTPDALREG